MRWRRVDHFGDWWRYISPEETLEYERAEHHLEDLVPILNRFHDERDICQAYGDMQGAIMASGIACNEGGLRHGAAFEHLRRTLGGEE